VVVVARIAVVALIALLTLPATALAPPPTASMSVVSGAHAFPGIDEGAADAVASGEIPGVVVLVGRGDDILFQGAYGSRRFLPKSSPMTVDTIFDIASLTKPVGTAIAVMALVEKGAIKLDAPLGQYLKEFRGKQFDEITIRRLMSHSAGLIAYPPNTAVTAGFPSAVAEIAKIPLEYERGSAEPQTRHLKDTLWQIHEQITQRWQSALANEASGQIARDYLAKRGVSADAVKLFRLGYAPDLWDDTVNWARSKSHELALVEKAGLILRKEGGENFYDRFRGRLIFPICDEQGRVIGFSGRILSGDEKAAKYVNSPETPIFTKSKVFFGLDKSKRALLDAEYAIVCEGQLDLIACFMAGVQNVVAPQGTALTADHTRILKRYVEEVVLCFDSDEAGQNAAVRSLDHLLASGLAVRVAVVPSPHDPDSFIKASGAEAFKGLIERAEGFFDFYLNRLCATNEVTTDKGRLAVLRGMAEAIHKTANVVLIDKYAQKTALRLGVTPGSVRSEFSSRFLASSISCLRLVSFSETLV